MEELDVLNSFVENGGCISLKQEYMNQGELSMISQSKDFSFSL